jgi:REP element-mobilizing transposase RayT
MERFPVRKRFRLPLPVYSQGNAFFITITTHLKHAWFHLHPKLSQTAIQIIRQLASLRHAAVYSWCIMPDHVHLLLQDQEVVDFVRLFKGKMTPMARKIEPKRRLWQRSFFDHALRKEESLTDIACCIWENPVRAAMADEPEKYPWSGSEVWPDWRRIYGRG